MSQESGARLGPEVQVRGNEITSLKSAKEAAKGIQQRSFDILLTGILEYEFGAVGDRDLLNNVKQTVRLNGPIQVEKLNAQSGEWEPVSSDSDLVQHLEDNLGWDGDTNPDKNTNHLTRFATDVSCGVQQVKQQYIDHQLTLIGDTSEESRKRLDNHTAVDLEGRIKFKKINSKGKVFNYSVRSGKKFREDVKTVLYKLETNERVPTKEKKINDKLVAFLTGAGVVLLNEFIIKGDHNTLQGLTVALSAIGYLSAHAGSVIEQALPGTRWGEAAKKVKEIGTKVLIASAGMAGMEVAVNAIHGVVYDSTSSNTTNHNHHDQININPNQHYHGYQSQVVENQQNGPLIDHSHLEQMPDGQTPSNIDSLANLDPAYTTEKQLKQQVEQVLSNNNWVNPENKVSKADVITQWIQKFWGHNKGKPLTPQQINVIKMVDNTKSLLDFIKARIGINSYISKNITAPN